MNSPDRHPQSHPAEFSSVTTEENRIDWPALEALTHRDPAARGLASFRREARPLDAGQLRGAAVHLARHAAGVAIVTGFCAVTNDRVTAETDGPPGALFLARALMALGIQPLVISDRYALPLLEAGCNAWRLDRKILVEFPFEDGDPAAAARANNGPSWDAKTDRWLDGFFAAGPGNRLSHIIAIERAGPSHTLESFQKQSRTAVAPSNSFSADVPAEDRNLCHDMRGQSINGWTAKTHRVFEWIGEKHLPIVTIGIGDGGNEIGMGRFAWELLVEAIGSAPAGRIACRIATDFALIAGVSNWAAYALALALCRLRGHAKLACDWTAPEQRELIELMVRKAGAVDGLSLRPEATVDGLSLETFLQPLVEIRNLLEIES
ncbi:MAG TPA: glutamate cyclase domain-containing protein [Pirellulales bacterium]|nr:glutamate cyclase domain-containing protein [Pirellulales bacterium]